MVEIIAITIECISNQMTSLKSPYYLLQLQYEICIVIALDFIAF